MRTLDYNINSDKNGGKVTGFNYSRSLNELVGSWNATVAGGTFKAGNSISFDNVMTDGIITRAYKDSTGLWHIEGKDAGVKLMKSTPDILELPTGNAFAVINYLADYCEMPLSMSGTGLSGFNVRSVVSGSTCAEAILELTMLSGLIAYIDNNGRLNIASPSKNTPSFSNIIDDSGSDIDLDGYATQILVNLTRRKWEDKEESTPGSEVIYYSGSTPSRTPEQKTYSGTFSNGSYSMIMLEPFDVIKKLETTITENGITLKTIEEHDYEHKSKVIWREDQEYVLFAFIETGYTLTKTAESVFNGVTFKETTTETLDRDLTVFDAIGVPEDWEGQIDMVDEETITRSTVREGGKTPTENMPSYSPPFDSQVVRTFHRGIRGKSLVCNETETTYEARQIGSISPVKINGELVPHFMLGSNLAIQTHSTPQWVPIKTYRTYYEQYDDDGECKVSTRSEYCDEGSEWLTANALSDTGDEDLNEYEKAYAKFSQQSHGLEVSVGSSQISSSWQFLELQGRTRSYENIEDKTNLGDISAWYDNGEYINSQVCPHYNSKQCSVYMLAGDNTKNCTELNSYGLFPMRFNFRSCPRAIAALNLAREQDSAQVEAPIIGTASVKTGAKVGYQRDIYIDEIISDEQAQTIANNIAANILAVKGTKGIRKTVTIPYDASYIPNGSIIEVSHDWENLQTSVTYLDDGDIPEFMISQSVSGIASFVLARENARQNIPQYGSVVSYSDGYALVKIGNSTVSCTTKLKNLGVNDIVLVAFVAGNKVRGQVIARL